MGFNVKFRLKELVGWLKVFSLVYCFVFLGFFTVLFSPIFYEFLFKILGVYSSELSYEFVSRAIDDLILFFLHSSELSLEFWNLKEIKHFEDVRRIYDFLILSFLGVCIFLSWFGFRFSELEFKRAIKFALGIVFLPLILFPVFSWFWIEVFHPILFSNDLWILNVNDLCFWIFPIEFFMGFYLIFVFIEVGGLAIFWFLGNYWFKGKKVLGLVLRK